MDPDQTAPIGAVFSGSTLFVSILNLSVMLGHYLQQTTFSDAFFFLGALRVNPYKPNGISHSSIGPAYFRFRVVGWCVFYSNFDRTFCKQKLETMIRRCMIWVCTVCL